MKQVSNYPEIIRTLLAQYKIEGPMTLRRCWYVLLSKQLVHEHPNPKNQGQKGAPYRRLSRILLAARINEDLPWELMVDRASGRRIDKPLCWDSVQQEVDYVLDNFNLDALEPQANYVEVWIEKEAVSQTIYGATAKFFVPLVVAKGFSSGTYLHDAAERFNAIDKPITLIYLSDLDPEGQYFPRLIKKQLPKRYNCQKDIGVLKVALTKSQVEAWSLPYIDLAVNAVHAKKYYVIEYLRENGKHKVELDAVDNVTLANLILQRLQILLDETLVEKIREESLAAVEEWKRLD
jgi:hypothetical protein